MSENAIPITDELLAREVFGPLGGIVEIGAVAAQGGWDPSDASVGVFVSHRQSEVDRLLGEIRDLGNFGSDVMAIVDEVGWLADHQVTPPSLLMWSGILEEISPRLSEPATIRRMCRMGADLQLTRFLQALVSLAVARSPEVERGAVRIVEAMHMAIGLVGNGDRITAETVFRMWRIAFLPGIFSPQSSAPESGRTGFRAYARVLEDLLDA
ncbi:hypothetical protein ACFPH6_40995 [Streptomyces xiangluensis]|uniref:TetR family transcriptional regulator n=1 Tax=Streptomyces xiangluensis TaxID=2665720 RepID=A0ABV8Z393_9ACTN